jgi:hypothetical protein
MGERAWQKRGAKLGHGKPFQIAISEIGNDGLYV